MGVFYIMGVIHGLLVDSLIKELPITRVYVFGMAFTGVIAWIYKAFLFKLFNKKLNYSILTINKLNSDIIELELIPEHNSLKYKAGQFAFFTFPSISKREQHPFTLSSHPHNDLLRITIKDLGDYTNALLTKLKLNDQVEVEGPYGKFSSAYSKEKEQVWIAGGIGITPFLSLMRDYYTQKVTLYWCINDKAEAVYKEELLEVAQKNPLFEFIIWDSNTKGHISVDDLSLREPKRKSYLICWSRSFKKEHHKTTKRRRRETARHL